MIDREESFLHKLYKHITEDDEGLLRKYYRFSRKDTAMLFILFFAVCLICTAMIIAIMGYSFYLGLATIIFSILIIAIASVWIGLKSRFPPL